MPGIDDALRMLKQFRPPRAAAGLEINKITGPLSDLDVWGLLEAVRLFVPCEPQHAQAVERLKAFVGAARPMKFTNLNRADVAVGGLARILNYSVVNQSQFGMCGPAAIAMDLAKSHPDEYASMIVRLCEDGECTTRGWKVKPDSRILAYNPGASMPAVDWVICASLRNEPANLQVEFSKETYGGSSVENVYGWMVKAGYRKVVGYCSLPLVSFCKTHPDTLKPPVLDARDKAKALDIMMDLVSAGWQVFLGGYMSLTAAVVALDRAQTIHHSLADDHPDMARQAYGATLRTQREILSRPVPGVMGSLEEAAKALILKQSPSDGRHWMYLEKMSPCSVDRSLVVLTCCTHGVRHSGINVPLEGLVNKYFGYVAVTDLG